MDLRRLGQTTTSWVQASWLTLAWASLFVAGCTNLNEARQNIARNQGVDVGPPRQKRAEEVAHDFDRDRDNAQFEAAASCWQRGDVEGCQKMLTQLLTRNPGYRRARFVLADIYLFNGDSNRAIDQLRQALESNPNDPMAHHALAQVLDASGQRSEALEHYEQAAKLDPKNEVYALSYNTVRASAGSAAALASTRPPEAAPMKPTPTNASKRAPSLTLTERPMPPTSPNSSSAATNQKPEPGRLNSQDANPQQPVKLASFDDWVRPMDFPNNSTDKPAGDAPKKMASVMTNSAASLVAAPVVAGPVTSRPSEAVSASAAPAESAHNLATPASYLPAANAAASKSADSHTASEKPADRQNQHNPLTRAVEALARGDTEGAIEWATAGLAQNPERPAPLYRLLGAAHYRRGEYQAAQMALGQALSLDKSDALSYFLMGSTLSKLGQPETAARCFAEAARLDPRYGS